MPAGSKQTKGKRKLTGQVDYVALSRDLVDAVESGVYIVQSKKFVYVNPFFARLTGYSREELIGTRSSKLVLPQDRPAVRKKATRNLKSRHASSPYEYRFIKKNGETIWVMETVSPIEYMGQKATLGSFVDITQRKQLEEALAHSEETYRAILEQMYDSYYEVDLAGNFTFVNDSVCRNLDYSSEEMVGQSYRFTTPSDDIKPLLLAFGEVFRTGNPNIGFAHGIFRKDGSIISVESSISLRENEQGEIIGFRSVSRDITGRKKLEDELQKLASVVQYSSELVNLSTPEGKMIFLNAAGARMLGIDPQKIDRFNIMQVIPDHLKEKVQSELLPALLKGATWEGDLQYLNLKTGALTDVHAVTFAVCDPVSGAPLYFANISLDITERKKGETALKESEERYRALFDRSPDLVYVRDLKGNFIDANPASLSLLGYRREDILTLNFASLLDPAQFPKTIQILKELTETGFQKEPSEFKLKRRDGKYLYVETQESVIYRNGRPHSVQGVGRDVTGRKKADMALKENEAKYRLLVETTTEVILVVQDLKIKFFNSRAVDLTGYTCDELNDMPFANLVYTDDLEKLADQHQRRLRGEPFERVYPFRYVLKGGKVGWAEISTALIDWEGRPATLSVLSDVTERKRSEEALQESEEKYRSLVENINDVFYTLDTQGNITYVSPVVERLSKYKISDLIGKPFIPLVYPDDLPALLESFERTVSGQLEPWEFRILDKDGRIIFVRSSSRPTYKDGEMVGVTALITDITERKKAEEALKASEERYRFITDNTADVVWALDSKLGYTYISPSVTRQRGYTVDEAMELNLTQVLTPESQDSVLKRLQIEASPNVDEQSRRIITFTQDMEMYKKDGSTFWTETSITILRTPEGAFDGLLGISRDITDRRLLQKKLEEMATHDFLTGLPNRLLLLDRFNIAAALAHRNKARLAVMSLDLDKFKTINDTLGHDAGDQVLKAVGKRLAGIIRASDTLARVGGDEFILLMMETNHVEDATAIAQKILDSFIEPLVINGHKLHLSTSIGIAIYPEDAEDMETLTKKSDAAMYYSKGHGRNQFKFFRDGNVHISGDNRSAA